MRHVIYALFDDPKEEEAALQEMDALGISREAAHVTEHRQDIRDTELNFGESDARHGLLLGVLIGAVGGAVLGGLLYGSFSAEIVIGGALIGAVISGLAGALVGTGLVDTRLLSIRRELKRGKILVTVEPEGLTTTDAVRAVFHKHGAREVGTATSPAAHPLPPA
jgi:hypothetical protein